MNEQTSPNPPSNPNEVVASMTRMRRIFYVLPVIALAIPFVANEYLQFMANAILVYSLVTVGFNVVIGNLGQLAFANTAFFGLGAYTTAILMVYAGMPYMLAVVAAAVVGGLSVSWPVLQRYAASDFITWLLSP